jgi:hypothetical protein
MRTRKKGGHTVGHADMPAEAIVWSPRLKTVGGNGASKKIRLLAGACRKQPKLTAGYRQVSLTEVHGF